MGEGVTCDLPDGADDHGQVGSRPKQVAVAGAVALLRIIAGVLQWWGCRATDKVPLQQLSTGQDNTVISKSYAKPAGRNAAVRCSYDGEVRKLICSRCWVPCNLCCCLHQLWMMELLSLSREVAQASTRPLVTCPTALP